MDKETVKALKTLLKENLSVRLRREDMFSSIDEETMSVKIFADIYFDDDLIVEAEEYIIIEEPK